MTPELPVHLLWIAAAFGLLWWGAGTLVDSAAHIARHFGVSDYLIGMTVVALGTSAPEMVVTLLAAAQDHANVSIGNVVGSNIFNLLLVLGVTTLIGNVPVPAGGHLDLGIVAVLSLILFLVSMTNNRQIIRTEAAVLLTVYVAYLTWRSMNAVGF